MSQSEVCESLWRHLCPPFTNLAFSWIGIICFLYYAMFGFAKIIIFFILRKIMKFRFSRILPNFVQKCKNRDNPKFKTIGKTLLPHLILMKTLQIFFVCKLSVEKRAKKNFSWRHHFYAIKYAGVQLWSQPLTTFTGFKSKMAKMTFFLHL